MSRSAKVRVQWLRQPPEAASTPGWRFSTPARFDHQGERWGEDAWSVVIVTDSAPLSNGKQSATATFLFPNAPQDWLAVGKRFTLHADTPLAEVLIESVVDE